MNIRLQSVLSNVLNEPIFIASKSPLSGGDINSVYKVITNKGAFCIKQNNRAQFPEMLKKEALGLKELSEHGGFRIPKVIGYLEDDESQYLILEFIENGTKSENFWERFGRQLATMHQVSSVHFGWSNDNYIGSLKQSNKEKSTWAEFYAEERILPQFKLAFDNQLIDTKTMKRGEQLCNRLDTLFPKEPPSLLHGDLWSGNYMTDISGNPVLIDPAVYFGHREMDLGMMQLFGGFSEQLYESYNIEHPLEHEWRERIPLTQLYPLLVHVNLFGGGYIQSVQSILQNFQ